MSIGIGWFVSAFGLVTDVNLLAGDLKIAKVSEEAVSLVVMHIDLCVNALKIAVWSHLTCDRDRWPADINTVMILLVP
jgi:hypothetical protein